jgi:hypothetical protein
MGAAFNYARTACGHRAQMVTDDFDCGMDGRVFTPVVCAKHGIAWGDTGIEAWADEKTPRLDIYPCSDCKRPSPRWDRKTCPACGKANMERDSDGMVLWD